MLLSLPFILAAVLVVSGIAKLRQPDDLEGWAELGVPVALRRSWLLRLHPWAELALTAGLLLLGGALGAVVALAVVLLMAAYLWLVVRALHSHADTSCACFGERTPVTRMTVLRNAWLLAVSLATLGSIWAVPALGGTARAVLGGAPVSPLEAVLSAAVAAVTTYLVVRQEPRTAPLPTAAPHAGDIELKYIRPRVPSISMQLGDGSTANIRDLVQFSPILLLSVNEGCRPCVQTIGRVPAWRALLPGVEVRLLTALTPEQSSVTERTAPQSLHDPGQHLRRSIAEWAMPTALLLGADGYIVGEPVTGYDEIAEFVVDIAESLTGERPGDTQVHGVVEPA
ncbi:MauE/DoxX family redox-associated membrane protein [Arthrobacter horti]|uniref:MauE/DoxX family redox-associated membrane protein n=1 Tax=Arthrobacter horti TaxID=3068273 RepID=UPI00273D2C24|nr:MauE/DoxX family redox-associated membrane protein [Arthrobacter sp. YJM1]